MRIIRGSIDQVIDFSLEDDRFLHLEPIARAVAVVTLKNEGEDFHNHLKNVYSTLSGYLEKDEHTVLGYRSSVPGSSDGLLIATPIEMEAFIAIKAGRYNFSYNSSGVYLPNPVDVLPFRKAEVIFIAAFAGSKGCQEGILEMACYLNGSFIMRSAWKRSIDVLCLTQEEKISEDLSLIIPAPKARSERIPLGNYWTHTVTVGPIFPKLLN